MLGDYQHICSMSDKRGGWRACTERGRRSRAPAPAGAALRRLALAARRQGGVPGRLPSRNPAMQCRPLQRQASCSGATQRQLAGLPGLGGSSNERRQRRALPHAGDGVGALTQSPRRCNPVTQNPHPVLKGAGAPVQVLLAPKGLLPNQQAQEFGGLGQGQQLPLLQGVQQVAEKLVRQHGQSTQPRSAGFWGLLCLSHQARVRLVVRRLARIDADVCGSRATAAPSHPLAAPGGTAAAPQVGASN